MADLQAEFLHADVATIAGIDMHIQQLRDLVKVVHHGGFRAAAMAYRVTQGGLSKSIAKLEDDLGIVLISRGSDGITLTEHGEEFLIRAKAVLLEIDRTDAWLRGVKTGATQSISIGMSVEPSLHLAPEVLQHFHRAVPDVIVYTKQTVASNLLIALRENQIDIALMLLPPAFAAADLSHDVIYETEHAVVGRKGHPCAAATSVQEIAKCDWIVVAGHSDEDAGIGMLFKERSLDPPNIAFVSDTIFCAVTMLRASDCLARLPRDIVHHPLLRSHLIRIPIHEPEQHQQIAIVRKTSRRLSTQAEKLIAMLTSYGRLLHPPRRGSQEMPSS